MTPTSLTHVQTKYLFIRLWFYLSSTQCFPISLVARGNEFICNWNLPINIWWLQRYTILLSIIWISEEISITCLTRINYLIFPKCFCVRYLFGRRKYKYTISAWSRHCCWLLAVAATNENYNFWILVYWAISLIKNTIYNFVFFTDVAE